MSLLEVRGLTVARSGRAVLDRVDLDLEPGGLLAVVGVNGSGRTTLLEALAGLIPLASGTIRLAGTDLGGTAPHRRARAGLGLVGKNRPVVPSLNVEENLALARFGAAQPRPWDWVEATFPALTARRGVAAGLLSGGEQQMLALAMGMVCRPQVLMLDEPAWGLAPAAADALHEALIRLRQEGQALLVAGHNPVRLVELGATVVVLEGGGIRPQPPGPASGADGAFGPGTASTEDSVIEPTSAEVTELVSLTLPVALKRRLQVRARERGVTPSELVAEAMRALLLGDR